MIRQSDDAGFDHLSAKQREVLACLSDGRTSKEIAHILEVSESAVNQRIEAIRHRFDGLPRKEIVRRFRHWQGDRAVPCKNLTGENIQLPPADFSAEMWRRDSAGEPLELADSATFELRAPWQEVEPRVVPEVLDGPDAVLQRVLAVVKIATILAVGMLTMLAVGSTLSNLLSLV